MPAGETERERAARFAAKDVLDKLGVRPGMAVRVSGAVDPALRARVRARTGRPLPRSGRADLVLLWPTTAGTITTALRTLRADIAPAGAVWVITAKRTAARASRPYVPDSVLIPAGAAARLVDNKICSVSETDTAMRFVVRVADR